MYICPEHFTDNIERKSKRDNSFGASRGGGGGVALLYKEAYVDVRWMESHFHDWIDYNDS